VEKLSNSQCSQEKSKVFQKIGKPEAPPFPDTPIKKSKKSRKFFIIFILEFT
jgi:hypothetical protein